MRALWFRIIGLSLCCLAGSGVADNALLQKQATHAFIDNMVDRYHFNRQELENTLRAAEFQPQIIASMERPYEKKSWDVYRALFLTPARLQAGLEFWKANRQALEQAEKQFGVPAPIIVAILGVETLYGKHQGNYRVLDALTTLAFYYPKRSEFFTKELQEFLLLCQEHHVAPTEYHGSYAGAMGKPQFMPSSYRFYALGMNGHAHPNLMQNDQDAIASVANYFHKHGWKMHDWVAEPVSRVHALPKGFAVNNKHADYEYRRLVRAGLISGAHPSHHPEKAGLIELTTQAGLNYWIAYPNFYVITRYNTSPQYALVVYLFSQQLHHQWALLNQHHAGS
jgi:membrane-bound lytic murein transglycosylase B